ncbi:hypothetical protein BDB00DRAFT_792040 [Zychaea mexicana]|uniref:uncharacterized protein n=1 Tax=Zychaea mexicana TaxID=64656 RepID=UPI0022FE7AFB|nr:uncharacterized protein BDB00DRAFT_792040 [Zychaea mexicana]KAI9488197.1 hypothetical protein BDB00DRAFT_792040 [Zychaea mexicana]
MQSTTSHRCYSPSATNNTVLQRSPSPLSQKQQQQQHAMDNRKNKQQQQLSQHPSLRRLHSCYETALKVLHIRASRRVAPLAVENSDTQEQNDRSVTPDADHHYNAACQRSNSDNTPTILREPSSTPCSPASFALSPAKSSGSGSTAHHRSPPEAMFLHEEKERRLQSNSSSSNHAKPSMSTSMSANGVLNKVLTRTKSTSRSLVTMASSSEKSSQKNYFTKLQQKHFRIYVKAPHYVAGGQISGSVVVNLPQHSSLLMPDPLDGIESFTFRFVGIEDIHDQANYNPATHTHQFLEVPIFHYGRDILAACHNHNGALKIPFTVQLPVDLGASYADKKAWVRYLLQT